MYPTNVISLPGKAELFYKSVLKVLQHHNARFLIGGSLALAHYMHLPRVPKDMDIFVSREECEQVLAFLNLHGYKTEIIHPHWLAKAYKDDYFIDFIFSSGNGIAQVDEEWFANARMMNLFDMDVPICASEEIIWSKAFIMDRERFDGADVIHLIHSAGKEFDWARLLKRFGAHWRVLLSHLVLFQYVFPREAHVIPAWVMETLMMRLSAEAQRAARPEKLCKGTLLSRDQYLSDVEIHGYSDGRVSPSGCMTEDEVKEYTEAFRAMQAKETAEKRMEKRRKKRAA